MTRIEKIEAIKKGKPFKLWDIFLFGIALVIIVVCVAVSFTKPKGKYVSVSVDGIIINYYLLSESGKYDIGGRLTLIIKDGVAYVEDSRCPDKICEKMGAIKTEGQWIICAPQHIVITVTADNDGKLGEIITG